MDSWQRGGPNGSDQAYPRDLLCSLSYIAASGSVIQSFNHSSPRQPHSRHHAPKHQAIVMKVVSIIIHHPSTMEPVALCSRVLPFPANHHGPDWTNTRAIFHLSVVAVGPSKQRRPRKTRDPRPRIVASAGLANRGQDQERPQRWWPLPILCPRGA